MRKKHFSSGCSLFGTVLLAGLGACSSSPGQTGGKGGGQAGASGMGGSGGSTTPLPDAGCKTGASSSDYVLIDDMETTTHGPIELVTGITSPLTPGYWYNSGASYFPDAGIDMSTPPQMSFAFTALATPTTTLCGKTSAHAARQSCVLNGLYDTCGVGFEFAQLPDHLDAGAASSSATAAADAGDAGPPIPRTTVPFDISRYKAITFWGMTTTPDPTTGSLQVKVQLPDTDTDPRGEVCNGGSADTSLCYNSYAQLLKFTTSWQQFTVELDAGGDSGVAPAGGIAIDPTWGYQRAKWIPTQVYGINWQAQRNDAPDAGPPLMTDIWIDDVYFIQ